MTWSRFVCYKGFAEFCEVKHGDGLARETSKSVSFPSPFPLSSALLSFLKYLTKRLYILVHRNNLLVQGPFCDLPVTLLLDIDDTVDWPRETDLDGKDNLYFTQDLHRNRPRGRYYLPLLKFTDRHRT